MRFRVHKGGGTKGYIGGTLVVRVWILGFY
jgi:hypothetical protein